MDVYNSIWVIVGICGCVFDMVFETANHIIHKCMMFIYFPWPHGHVLIHRRVQSWWTPITEVHYGSITEATEGDHRACDDIAHLDKSLGLEGIGYA